MKNGIWTGSSKDNLFIRLVGKMSFVEAGLLKRFLFSLSKSLQKERKQPTLVIDFQDCCYVDSTFLGFLVMLKKKWKVLCNTEMYLQNIHHPVQKFFEDMNLDSFFLHTIKMDLKSNLQLTKLIEENMDKEEMLHLFYLTHEALCKTGEDVKKQFHESTNEFRKALGICVSVESDKLDHFL